MLYWFTHLPLITQLLAVYLIFINMVTFFYFGADKIKSQFSRRRISERTLWILTLFGGSLGALTGMHYFRHKTKKLSFQTIVAMILMIHLWLSYWIFI